MSDDFAKRVFVVINDQPQWITVHPNGVGTKGTPVMIEGRTGEVLAGMGGKFNGRHISAVPQGGKNEEHGAAATIKWFKTSKGNVAMKVPGGSGTKQPPAKKIPSHVAKTLGTGYYDASQKAIANGHKTAKRVWEKFEGRCKIDTTTGKKSGFFSYDTLGITFDAAKDAKEDAGHAPWSTMYHEFGHNIDFINRSSNAPNYFSHEYKNGIFADTLRAEVKKLVAIRLKQLKEDFKNLPLAEYVEKYKAGWDYYLYKSYKGNDRLARVSAKPSVKMIYTMLSNEIKMNPAKSASDISDIFEGASDAKIKGDWGHGKAYWKKRAHRLAGESFANMFSASLTAKEGLGEIKKYFPESVKIFEQMLSDLEKKS